jgi:hypothetical protein
MKNTSMKALLLSAAMTGLLAGANAATTPVNNTNGQTAVKASTGSSVLLAKGDDTKKDKHACAGKNDCKGKGGCKSSDTGCKGKNSCKGKGGCATDGSKMPS